MVRRPDSAACAESDALRKLAIESDVYRVSTGIWHTHVSRREASVLTGQWFADSILRVIGAAALRALQIAA